MQNTVNQGLAKISKSQQSEFESLLGRLQAKYKVRLSMPAFDFDYMPFRLTLGDTKHEVPLDDWGSGTKNRTLILLTLFRARQVGVSVTSASKITPIIIVEEPESFLHPSAQAEFGHVLQDLSEEFQVQVIVTTHSPNRLRRRDPTANILLQRRTSYKRLRETEQVDTTGPSWMEPFARALGLASSEFGPWKNLILGVSDTVLLVEGDTDKQYFELLCGEEHGAQRLIRPATVYSYGGVGNLTNSALLRFITNRHHVFLTFDLDKEGDVRQCLGSLMLGKGKDYLPVGVNSAGKRSIEGLLPERVRMGVYGAHPDIVQAATAGNRDEQRTAKNQLKELLLAEFRRVAKPGTEDFAPFYKLAKVINKSLG